MRARRSAFVKGVLGGLEWWLWGRGWCVDDCCEWEASVVLYMVSGSWVRLVLVIAIAGICMVGGDGEGVAGMRQPLAMERDTNLMLAEALIDLYLLRGGRGVSDGPYYCWFLHGQRAYQPKVILPMERHEACSRFS